jgi:chromosome segregation ATPase
MSTDIQKALAERKAIETTNKELKEKLGKCRNLIKSAEETISKHKSKMRDIESEISKNTDRYYALGKVFLNQ